MDMSAFEFFSQLTQSAKDFLKMRLHPIEVPANTVLFYEGDICDSILFLTSGEVSLFQQINETEEKELYTLEAANQCIVNTASTLSQTPAIASAIAKTEIKGYILDMYSLQELAKKSDVFLAYLFSLYTLDLCKTLKQDSLS